MNVDSMSALVGSALDYYAAAQEVNSRNFGATGTGRGFKVVADFNEILAEHLEAGGSYQSFWAEASQLVDEYVTVNAREVALPEVVLSSQRLSGSYKNIGTVYNQMVELYQVALGKGK
ncbi:hypothetical protein JF535_14995 [Microbulbifer salipaludis]|uniref:Uncharacterized protein n=1 Tax=Microbulbifer salipaludis TaxID=187980 RepID=A0ABS3EA17_9GAMM|nr:hypothetical protein [Microbulbifer salipaludis]MBN8432157.1 hypothetical protein [Microbulbifer salipaludis]